MCLVIKVPESMNINRVNKFWRSHVFLVLQEKNKTANGTVTCPQGSSSGCCYLCAPYFSIRTLCDLNYPAQQPIISMGILILHQYYVAHREVTLTVLPLRSALQVLKTLPTPPNPELVGQVLSPSPPVSCVEILLDEMALRGHGRTSLQSV